jgi:hypothetical protein
MSENTTGWQGVNAMDFDGSRGQEFRPVPGVPTVSQPMLLAVDEWVCGGCFEPIISPDGSNASITHKTGCPAMGKLMGAGAQ